MIKFQAAILTDMPVQELSSVLGPVYRQQGIFITRQAFKSSDHLRALVGTLQGRAERAKKRFSATIAPAGTKPSFDPQKYVVEGPLKHQIDYDRPRDAGTTMPMKEMSFFDRLAEYIKD